MFRKLLAAAVVATALGTAVAPEVASAQVYVQVAPPPLRVEPVPAPRRGYVWVPGHWQWRGHRHVWVAGHWIGARPGYRYYGPRWVEHNGRWLYESGRWGRGDADRDGIPDRYDRHPRNPYRP